MVIGYYVHHAGAGHRTRAQVLSAALRARGHDVMLLGSDLGEQPGLQLPRDDGGVDGTWRDPQAGGALHWAPLGRNGFSARMEMLAQWVSDSRPDVVVVDVSVEVTLAVRLLGVPVVVMAQPGHRVDDPHLLGYRCASIVVAPWPRSARLCPVLDVVGPKVHHVGGVSSLTRQARQPQDVGVVLSGRDGWEYPSLIGDLRRQVPAMRWEEVGGAHWVNDVGTVLNTARVVVTHAGQNAVADVASCDVPTVVIAQPRPHDEQRHMASELDRLGLAVSVRQLGPGTPWERIIPTAIAGESRWSMWQTEHSADRAATVVESVAQ